MDQPSPLESILGIIGSLPQGQDKPVKQALYNAFAIFFIFLCVTALLGLYCILQPFVKPLMWAVLVGSALHPLKRSLRDRFQRWFQMLEDTNTPTALGLVLLPVNIFNNLSECIGEFLWERVKVILIIGIVILVAILLYLFSPKFLVSVVWTSVIWSYKFLNFVISNSTLTVLSAIFAIYLPLVFLTWNQQNNKYFHYASIFIWILGSCCLSSLFGSLQTPIFLIMQVVFFGGFISEVYEAYCNMKSAGIKIAFTDLLSIAFHDKSVEDLDIGDLDDKKEVKDLPSPMVQFSQSDTPKADGDPWSLELFNEQSPQTGVLITKEGIHVVHQKSESSIKKLRPKFQRSLSQPQFNRSRKSNLFDFSRKISKTKGINQTVIDASYESNCYMYSVTWCCVVMIFWKNLMLLPLLTIPIVYYTIKHLGTYLGLWSYLADKLSIVFDSLTDWCVERHDALVPVPIRGIYKVMHKINVTLKNAVKGSIDTVASCVVIFGLIVFLICASIFTALQIYSEGIMLVQMTSNAINQTVVQNPELRQMLPPMWDETVDSVLDNAYQYGRQGISKAIRSVMNNADSVQSENLENQVLELWDRLYQSWMTSNENNGPKVTEDAVKSSWEAFLGNIQKSPEMFNVNGIVDFAKQNVGTLMSLLESIWSLLIGNISLIIGSFSTFVSILLGGGTALLNFVINVFVFLTTLFYLLTASRSNYKPVEVLTQFLPSGKKFGHALEDGIYGVFSVTLKMAAFYGMWTWFIHNLFNVRIVYISSALATVLAAIPFFGTYWACVPGILDLWLSQDRMMAAILFAGFQFLPTSIVDSTIYKEIKGSHPYISGLAIAGGIYCMGVEGAIIGPLLLCGLYVAMDLSKSLFKESPTDESINIGLHQL